MINIQQYKQTVTLPAGFSPPMDASPEYTISTPEIALNGILHKIAIVLPAENTKTINAHVYDDLGVNVININGNTTGQTDYTVKTVVAGFHKVNFQNGDSSPLDEDTEVTLVYYIEE